MREFKPSDLNTILARQHHYTEDGMEPIHQRQYNQGRDLNKYYDKLNNELDNVLDILENEYGYYISTENDEDDYDLLHIRFHTPMNNVYFAHKVEDVDDLVVELEKRYRNNKEVADLVKLVNSSAT